MNPIKIPKVEARNVLAFVVTFFMLGNHGILLVIDIPVGNKEIYSQMTTLITGGWLTVLAFYFGDSKKHPEDKGGVVVNTTDAVNVDQTEKAKV